MEEKLPTSASLIRTKYARVFELIAQLYQLKTNEKVSNQFENIVKITEEMYESKVLSDYLYENLKQVYDLYPLLLPGNVVSGYKENPVEEERKLKQIDDLLGLLIRDLNDEISDVAESIAERMKIDLVDEDKWVSHLFFFYSAA